MDRTRTQARKRQPSPFAAQLGLVCLPPCHEEERELHAVLHDEVGTLCPAPMKRIGFETARWSCWDVDMTKARRRTRGAGFLLSCNAGLLSLWLKLLARFGSVTYTFYFLSLMVPNYAPRCPRIPRGTHQDTVG